MKILVLDFVDWGYDPETPYVQPLGGMQSAVCYLSEALAQCGDEVFLLTRGGRAQVSRGVYCFPISVDQEVLRHSLRATQADVCVVVGASSVATQIRPLLPSKTPLVLWTGHAFDQPHNRALRDPAVRRAWSAFAFCGSWQRDTFVREFDIPEQKTTVIGYGVAPAFAELLSSPSPKPDNRITLAYTSTPFRGLGVLLSAFPLIRAAKPTATLRVFSSMKVYRGDDTVPEIAELYRRCHELDGVEYVGSLPQPQLAEQMKAVSIFSYPNTFAETACIAAMEAMASGCKVVTTDLGALPETTAGFARLVAPPSEDLAEFTRAFAEATIDTIGEIERTPVAQRPALLGDQLEFVRQNYTWACRAAQGRGIFDQLLQG